MGKQVGLLLGPTFFILLHFFTHHGLSSQAITVIALAVWMVTWWITEAVSISVTALLPLVIFPLFNIMSMNEVGANYGSSIVFLFFGGFVLALALEKVNLMDNATKIIKTERQRIIETLQKFDTFEVFDSKANFVLFDAHSSYKRVYSALAEQGISIRKLGKIGNHEGCLRVTIGTKEMNSKFLLAIRDLLG